MTNTSTLVSNLMADSAPQEKKTGTPMKLTPKSIAIKHCRVCHSRNIKDLNTLKSFYLLNFDLSVDMPYIACADCDFISQGRFVGDEFLSSYYNKSTMLRRKEPQAQEEDQNRRQTHFLSSHIEIENKRVLEVGSSTGFFLKHLHEHHAASIYFDELSEDAVAILESQPEFKNFRKYNDKMNLIVLRHVLEHIYDLDDFLAHLDSITEDDGQIFVEVPDWSHLDGHTDPLNFEHINQFNAANLVSLFNRNGWSCEALEKSICATDPASPNRVLRLIFQKKPNCNEIDIRFEKFMEEHHDHLNNSINTVLSYLGQDKSVALYPASHLTFSAIKETCLSDFNVVGLFDIDKKKHGKKVNEVEIFPAENLLSANADVIILLTMAYETEIINSLKSMGVTSPIIAVSQLVDKEFDINFVLKK